MHRDLQAALEKRISGEVRFDPYSRVLYSTDASIYQIMPIGVVLPRDADDVQAAVEVAGAFGVPVLARGAGSSLAGQAVGAALVLDFSRHLDRVLEINPHERTVRVQPGVVADQLNAALKPHSLHLGVEPASSDRATLGGMIANNATGARSILYGMTADSLLAADVILADASRASLRDLTPEELAHKQTLNSLEGELYRALPGLARAHEAAIRERFPRTWRRASGYSLNYLLDFAPSRPPGWAPGPARGAGSPVPDPGAGNLAPQPYPPPTGFNLARLLAGSEGTLAVITEATLRVVPRPAATALCAVHFDSVLQAVSATPVALGFGPSAVELIDRMLIDLTRSVPSFARLLGFVQGRPGAILAVEFYGEGERELLGKLERLEAGLRRAGMGTAFVRALTPRQQAEVWGVRRAGLGLLQSTRGDIKTIPFMEDVAVPVEHLACYVEGVQAIFAEYGVQASFYAHASAGCLHIRPMISLKSAGGVQTMRAIAEAVLALTISLGGAMSGEHGDGLARSEWNARLFGPELYQAFRQVKAAFDPRGLLNPGKVVDAPPMDRNLRYGEAYRPLSGTFGAASPPTELDFRAEGGFAGAVEQCNGAAVCRKGGGVMCPSFQATREEEHSTRGRANALRAALSGALPPAALTDPRMHAVLDLCLECKGCKAECPSGVDMAKIKYEFLHQYQRIHGVPLRSRLFANIHQLSRIGQAMWPLANMLLASAPARLLNEKLLGIARQRALPAFAPQRFSEWRPPVGDLRPTPGAGSRGQVLLFTDTFTEFNQPQVGIAAVKLLERAGFEVLLAPHGCCGRPMISKGMLEQARAAARHVVAALAPYAGRGIPIVGLEPSCLLTLRDEYLDLLPDDPRARQVAGAARMIEELELELELELERRVLLYGHCHQKAQGGTAALKRMLELPGWEVEEIEAGCCGMAGAFGYEVEHYALSQQIGELQLFPAVRKGAGQGAAIVASGFSCRHQIAAATGVMPQHPVELLAEALA